MEISERSRKSREVHADSLMKVSTSLLVAFFITILVVPMGVVIKNLFIFPLDYSLFATKSYWTELSVKICIFAVCEFGIYKYAFSLKKTALDIYDELYPDEKTMNKL